MAATDPLNPWRVELRETLRLAAPLAMTNLLQMLVHAVDVIFVARLGPQALAASSLAIAVFGLTMWSLSGLVGACAPLIAAELGRRDHAVREVRRSVRMALWLAALFGSLGMIICANAEALMLASGQDPAVAALSGRFMGLLLWAMIPMIAAGVLRIFVATLGRPIFATAITGLSILVNALGNWVFVFGNLGAPALGLEGSAISSILTSVLMLGAYALAIRADRRLRRYHVFGRWWRAEWSRLLEILRLGTPIALTILAEAGLFSAAALLMGRIGEVQLAAHTLALNVASLAFQVPFGIGQAATIRVGYFYGAQDRVAAGRAGWTALGLSVCFMVVTATAMLLVPTVILRIYIDPDAPANAALVGFAVQYMLVAAAFQLFDGPQTVAAGALRGLQDTRMPLLIALFGYWGIGFSTSIGLGLNTPLAGVGVWIGLAVGLLIAALLLTRRWHRREVLKLV